MSALYTRPFNHRFGYTLFLALAAHLLFILLIAFKISADSDIKPTLEVTLAHTQTAKENPDADFLAQMNQLGSGESKTLKKLANDNSASDDNHLSERDKTRHHAANQGSEQRETSSATSTAKAPRLQKNYDTLEVVISPDAEITTLLAQQMPFLSGGQLQLPSEEQEIAALLAQIEKRREQMAKAPKRRIISALSTKTDTDAAYLDSWRRRIEDVGNIHYPKAADEQKLYGTLRLSVAIDSSGKLKNIIILKSSGSLILDNAAIKIVKIAAPFPPFPAQMQKNTDILEIIRTWKFEKTTRVY